MMIIRKWKVEDFIQIMSLLSEMNEALGEDQEIEFGNVFENFKAMEQQKDTYENYVIEENKKILGFMSLLFYRSIYHKKGTVQINELIVKKEYRSKGLGQKLLQYGIKVGRERGVDEIEIGVEKDNTRAIEFYKKNGINEEYVLLGKEYK